MNNVEAFKLLYLQFMDAPSGSEAEDQILTKIYAATAKMSMPEMREMMDFVLNAKGKADAVMELPPHIKPTPALTLFKSALSAWIDSQSNSEERAMASFGLQQLWRSMSDEDFANAMEFQRIVFERIEKFDPEELRNPQRS